MAYECMRLLRKLPLCRHLTMLTWITPRFCVAQTISKIWVYEYELHISFHHNRRQLSSCRKAGRKPRVAEQPGGSRLLPMYLLQTDRLSNSYNSFLNHQRAAAVSWSYGWRKCTLQNLVAARHRRRIRGVRDAPANGSAYSRDLLAQEALARVDVPRLLNVSGSMALRFALINSDTCD